MKLDLDPHKLRHPIQLKLPYVQIGQTIWKKSCWLNPSSTPQPWPEADQPFSQTAISPLLSSQPQTIIIGSEPVPFPPHQWPKAHLHAQKIGFDWMNLAAACRTYTLLVSEGRNVTLGLII
jgi:uncharacterized protein